MWETLKKQLVDKIIIEVKSKNNWEIIKQFIGNEKIDEIFIIPILNKISNHLNKYLIFFLIINILIMVLIITNIIITIYYNK